MPRKLIRLILSVCLGINLCAQQTKDGMYSVDLHDDLVIEMVWVEGGSFIMGSNDGRGTTTRYDASHPEHKVMIDGFYMSRFEVTQELYKAVLDTNPSYFTGNDSLPVEMVTWDDAQRFVAILSQMIGKLFRLPTEAEWEYAARGGKYNKGMPYAGCTRDDINRYVWFCVNSGNHTHPVGRLLPNELGLYDMSGNVAEWCSDWMTDYTADMTENPIGPNEGDSRIVRGGNWGSVSAGCAVFDRGWYVPTGKTEYYGFRIVMESPQTDDE